jgi:hypothetical protein
MTAGDRAGQSGSHGCHSLILKRRSNHAGDPWDSDPGTRDPRRQRLTLATETVEWRQSPEVRRTAEAAPAKFVLSIPRFSTGSAFSLAGGRHPAVLHVLRPTSSTETGHAQLEPLLLRQPRASRRRHRARLGVVRAPLRLLAPLAGIRPRAAGGCVCQRQLRDRSDAPLHRVTPSWAAAGQDSSGWPR